jgi:hypothetical protein
MPLTVSSLLLSAVLAYRSDNEVRVLYGMSSGLGFLVFPFTVWFMEPVNKVLIAQGKAVGEKKMRAGDEEVETDKGMRNARVSLGWRGCAEMVFADRVFRILLRRGVGIIGSESRCLGVLLR